MNKRHLAIAALVLLALCSVLDAQSTRVEVFGIVRDPAGLPVSGAAVQIRNVDTSSSAETTSDSAGLYRFVALLPGSYEITVRKDGFSLLKRSGLTLRVGEQTPVDLSLALGNLSQSVEVSEAAPLLQDVRGTVSFTATREEIATLPLAGRAPVNTSTTASAFFNRSRARSHISRCPMQSRNSVSRPTAIPRSMEGPT